MGFEKFLTNEYIEEFVQHSKRLNIKNKKHKILIKKILKSNGS